MIRKLFNWRDNPENIFLLVFPLGIMGFMCLGAVAVLQWYQHNNPWYTIILFLGLMLFVVAGYPVLKLIKAAHDQKARINAGS